MSDALFEHFNRWFMAVVSCAESYPLQEAAGRSWFGETTGEGE